MKQVYSNVSDLVHFPINLELTFSGENVEVIMNNNLKVTEKI